MSLGLRAGLSFGIADGRAIFLDSCADRYFCLPADLNAEFLALVQRADPGSNVHPALIPLLSTDAVHRLLPAKPELATSDCRASSTSKTDAGVYLQMLMTQALCRLAIHTSLDRQFEHISRRQRRIRTALTLASHREQILHLLNAFDRTRFLFEAQDRCLHQSIALSHILAARGMRTSLVLGVRPRPFSAHCWLQQGSVVLNDEVDSVRAYVPVRVVA